MFKNFLLTNTSFLCSLRFLQDHSFFAVAQKKYVFIYDHDGVEIHRLKAHIEPTRLEFLPYHWLLASVVRLIHLSFGVAYQLSSAGKCWISEISGYIDWPAPRRTSYQVRCL